jgi:hypothetical protein|tara:strand:- start:3727 stop:3915 length:189 start_codon:yes stop_codon:yes gene_type:complete
MTDISLYKNITISKNAYKKLNILTENILPHTRLSKSKTVESLIDDKFAKLKKSRKLKVNGGA